MCIIFYATNSRAVKAITPMALVTAWAGNRDGAGIAYRLTRTSRLVVKKGIMDLPSLLEAWESIQRKGAVEAAVHLRVATGGAVAEVNTHPFTLRHGALFHNGVLSISAMGYESDTARFARLVHRMPLVDIMELGSCAGVWKGSRILAMPHVPGPSLRAGDWHPGIVRGLWLSQGYSCPAMVKARKVVVLPGVQHSWVDPDPETSAIQSWENYLRNRPGGSIE